LERGFIGFPRGLEDEYFRQLTAERRKEEKRKDGFVAYKWVKDPNQANEALDTMNQAEAAAIRLGVRDFTEALWDKLESERERPPEAAQLDLEDLPLLKPPPQPVIRKAGTPAPNSANPIPPVSLPLLSTPADPSIAAPKPLRRKFAGRLAGVRD
jgi:phage terminase large subunit GpA-like protein